MIRLLSIFSAILCIGLPAMAASAEQAEGSKKAAKERIRKVTERLPKLEEIKQHGRDAAARLAQPHVTALEFVDEGGRVKKRVALPRKEEEGLEVVVDVGVSGDGRYAAVMHKEVDRKERNPYKLRRSSSTEITWYDAEGTVVGRRKFGTSASGPLMSENGKAAVITDVGFDPEELASYRDVPGLKTTETLKRDPDLIDHFIYVVRPAGEMIKTVRLKGPGGHPTTMAVSALGKWLTYMVGSPAGTVTIINLETGVEEKFEGPAAQWQVADSGEIFGWVLEKNEARYEKVDGRIVGRPGKRFFRMHRRALGEAAFRSTDETMQK